MEKVKVKVVSLDPPEVEVIHPPLLDPDEGVVITGLIVMSKDDPIFKPLLKGKSVGDVLHVPIEVFGRVEVASPDYL